MAEELNKSKLARTVGVARSTLYEWLQAPNCPNPDESPDEFLRWCERRKAESRGGGLLRDVADVGDLKSAKLRGEVVRLWEGIDCYEQTLRATVEEAAWEEVMDILGEYKSTISRMPLADSQRDELNRLLAEAVERAEARRGDANARLEERFHRLRSLVAQAEPDR